MWDKKVHNFPKGIIQKVNVLARLEFKLALSGVTVQHFSTLEKCYWSTYVCVCVCVCVCVFARVSMCAYIHICIFLDRDNVTNIYRYVFIIVYIGGIDNRKHCSLLYLFQENQLWWVLSCQYDLLRYPISPQLFLDQRVSKLSFRLTLAESNQYLVHL